MRPRPYYCNYTQTVLSDEKRVSDKIKSDVGTYTQRFFFGGSYCTYELLAFDVETLLCCIYCLPIS